MRAALIVQPVDFTPGGNPSGTRRVIVVPGYDATPADNWFPWLATHLDHRGVPTRVLTMPTPSSPSPDAWEHALREALHDLDDSTSVVAHSLGCVAVLRHLARRGDPWRLDSLVLVAGFIEPLPDLPELDHFVTDTISCAAVTDRIRAITVIRSDDDPTVPRGHTDRLAQSVGVVPVEISGAGHFTTRDGVTHVPEIVDVLHH